MKIGYAADGALSLMSYRNGKVIRALLMVGAVFLLAMVGVGVIVGRFSGGSGAGQSVRLNLARGWAEAARELPATMAECAAKVPGKHHVFVNDAAGLTFEVRDAEIVWLRDGGRICGAFLNWPGVSDADLHATGTAALATALKQREGTRFAAQTVLDHTAKRIQIGQRPMGSVDLGGVFSGGVGVRVMLSPTFDQTYPWTVTFAIE